MSVHSDDGVLADITNKVNNLLSKAEEAQRVKDAHWAEPQKFDYDTYNASSKDQRPAAPAEGGEADDPPTWAANATKYEWSDEYGEVGPKHEALEHQLFGGEHQMEQGTEFSK